MTILSKKSKVFQPLEEVFLFLWASPGQTSILRHQYIPPPLQYTHTNVRGNKGVGGVRNTNGEGKKRNNCRDIPLVLPHLPPPSTPVFFRSYLSPNPISDKMAGFFFLGDDTYFFPPPPPPPHYPNYFHPLHFIYLPGAINELCMCGVGKFNGVEWGERDVLQISLNIHLNRG